MPDYFPFFFLFFAWAPHWNETRRVIQKNSYFQWELNQFALQYQKQKYHTEYVSKNLEKKDIMFQNLSLIGKMH